MHRNINLMIFFDQKQEDKDLFDFSSPIPNAIRTILMRYIYDTPQYAALHGAIYHSF